MKTDDNTRATFGIPFKGFTFSQGSQSISNFKGFQHMLENSTGSLVEVLENHGFTGTQGTRPNVAPDTIII